MTLTLRLTPRRRNVLCLRAAGYSQGQIARRLDISLGLVRKDVKAISHALIPGVTDGAPGESKGYRLAYVLGLLDAGADPDDVPDYLQALEDRVAWRESQAPAPNDPEDAPAEPAGVAPSAHG